MLRTELVAKLAAENPNLTRSDAEKVVSTIFDAIVRHLEEGGRVEFRGFGAYRNVSTTLRQWLLDFRLGFLRLVLVG